MKIQFLGAAETVTGSKYLLRTHDKCILVDCGLFQGLKELRLRNWKPFPFPPAKIDAVVLTHAHMDHSGYLPLLVKEGFEGPIYATAATRDLCEILLRDSGRLQEDDAKRANRYGYTKHKPALPLYTEEDAILAMKQFRTFTVGQDLDLGDEVKMHASRAGHILGAAMLSFRTPRATVLFTGDLGRLNDPIMVRPATIQTADYIVTESTYGDRLHPNVDDGEALGAIIRDTSKRGGVVVIPSFAVGRAEEILYLIYKLKLAHAIPDIPIYLDSPMAQDASDLMCRYIADHRLPKDVCQSVGKVAHYVRTTEESKRLHQSDSPKVIISASGMVEGGRVLHHIAHYGPDAKNTIVFTGYQAAMTRGEQILHGAEAVKIHGVMVPIRAQVASLEGLSGHADYSEILEWLQGFTKAPTRLFLTHGEKGAAESLKAKIEERFGWNVTIPTYMEEVAL